MLRKLAKQFKISNRHIAGVGMVIDNIITIVNENKLFWQISLKTESLKNIFLEAATGDILQERSS